MLSLGDVAFEDAPEPVDVVSTLAPEQRDRACEVLEGSDDETIQAFITRLREKL